MDGTIDRPPGRAPRGPSTTRKRKRSMTNPRSQHTNSGSNSSSTPQQTLEAQSQRTPIRVLNVEFSFSEVTYLSMPAAPFPRMPVKPAGGTSPGARVNTTSSVNTPSRPATNTPRGLLVTTPASTTTSNTLPNQEDLKFKRLKDAITAIPLDKVDTGVYLDLVSNHYNQIMKPPEARIYDILWLHSYLFHHKHLLLELPAGRKTWRPVQCVWHATSLPYVSSRKIEEICQRNLTYRTGFEKEEIVQGWPTSHSHSIAASSGAKKIYGCSLDIIWEVKLGIGIKGVGDNWEDVVPKACVTASNTELRQSRGADLGSKFRWFTEEEVRGGWKSSQGERLLPELTHLVLVAFVVRRKREDEYLGVYGLGTGRQ